MSRTCARTAPGFAFVCATLVAITCAARASAQDAIFGPVVRYDLGSRRARAIAVADLDGDGRGDLAATTCTAADDCRAVIILLANADGTFRSPVAVRSGGNGGDAIAAADVNGDTRIDLLVANRITNAVAVLLGNGDGTFQPPLAHRSGSGSSGPISVAAVDLNNDTLVDIAVAHADSNGDLARPIGVSLGRGDGTFEAPLAYASGGRSPRTVHAADVNGDHAPDLVIVNEQASGPDSTHGAVAVLLADGIGRFQPAVSQSSGGATPGSATTADVNGDNQVDVIVMNSGANAIGVLINRDGALESPRTFRAGQPPPAYGVDPRSVAVADVNGDQRVDILAGTCAGGGCSGALIVLAGDGMGDFVSAGEYASGGVGGGIVAAADLDGDARADAAVATCASWECTDGSIGVLLQSTPATRAGDAVNVRQASATFASAALLAGAAPATIAAIPGAGGAFNLRVATDASPDLTDLPSFIHSTTSRWPSNQEKVWALFYWTHILKRQTAPMVLHGFELTDPIRNFTDYGFTMCSTISGINQSLHESIGLRHQYWDICNHTVSTVEYDGKFRMIDSSMSHLVTTADGVSLASLQEAAADSARLVRERNLYSTSPNGFLTGSDTIRNLADVADPATGAITTGFSRAFCSNGLYHRTYYYNWEAGHRYVLNLRQDETYTRYYRRLGTTAEYWVGSERIASADPANTFEIDSANRFGIRGNGTWLFSPKLSAADYARAAYRSSNIAVAAAGGLTLAVPAQPAEVIYKVQAGNAITSQRIRAQFNRVDPAATATIAVSLNHGATWTQVGDVGTAVGGVPVTVNVRNEVSGAYETLVRIQMTGTAGTPEGVVLTDIDIDTTTQVNTKALPKLNVGRNEIFVGAGDQSDSMVLWPDLRGTFWQRDAYDAQNIAAQSVTVPRKYTATAYPAVLTQDAYLTYRMDAPTDITRLVYGGRLYNVNAGSYIDFLHSFDGGATWVRSYRLSDVKAPYDVIHHETVTNVPAGVRSVLFKYLIHNTATSVSKTSGLYSVRMEVNHRPVTEAPGPVDLTLRWKEVRADRTLVDRSHKQRVEEFPFRYVINVGGSDHPVMESIKMNLADPADPTPFGYSDGNDVGGERYVHRKRIDGTNVAVNRPYTFSRTPSGFQSSAGATNTTILTDSVVGAPGTGGFSYWWGQCWSSGPNVDLRVDLGSAQMVSAFRAHLFGYPFWDALKGQVQDRVEVLTSLDGVTFTSQGFLETALWRKDIPINHMLQDDEKATGWNFELRTAPVSARYVLYRATPKRILCASELQVLDAVDYEPFDIRIALPDDVGLPGGDLISPTVALTAPASGARVAGAVQLAATASDNVAVARVDLLANGVVVGSVSAPPYTVSWDSTRVADGPATIIARAVDAAGNTSTSASVTVTVDNVPDGDTTAPTAALTAPSQGETVSGMVSLEGSASDNVGVTAVTFLVNGSPVGSDTIAPYAVSWNSADVANGTATITVRAADAAGNTTTATPVTVTVGNAGGSAPQEIVLHAGRATTVVGAWRAEPLATAAGGMLMRHPNAGAARLSASATPANYFELRFWAVANTPYHLWLRGRADSNHWANDSVYVQFSNVTAYPIGTTSATTVTLEDCISCGVSGWGWQDNGFGANVLGPDITFTTTGWQTIRFQTREDGLAIDQVILSPSRFRTTSPGTLKGDTTIYPANDGNGSTDMTFPTAAVTAPAAGVTVSGMVALEAAASDNVGVAEVVFVVNSTVVGRDTTAPYAVSWDSTQVANGSATISVRATDAAGNTTTATPVAVTVDNAPNTSGHEIVLYAGRATVVAGAWRAEPLATAAGGTLMRHPNAGAAKVSASATPANYFELTFWATANTPYHLWLRGRADGNYWANDSAYVQFSNVAAYPIGTTAAATVTLEDCTHCGVSGWGWQDNAFGANSLGPDVTFTTTGWQTIRIQTREDGLAIDQVILSPSRFRTTPPGALKGDTAIYPAADGTSP